MFFLTVIFGLFHGLVFLPVLLTMMGSNNIVVTEHSESSGYTDTTSASASEKKVSVKAMQQGFTNKGYVSDEVRAMPLARN